MSVESAGNYKSKIEIGRAMDAMRDPETIAGLIGIIAGLCHDETMECARRNAEGTTDVTTVAHKKALGRRNGLRNALNLLGQESTVMDIEERAMDVM